jgi:hypothetical protein
MPDNLAEFTTPDFGDCHGNQRLTGLRLRL